MSEVKNTTKEIIKLAREISYEQSISFEQALIAMQIEALWKVAENITY